jgi:hypothetical protein
MSARQAYGSQLTDGDTPQWRALRVLAALTPTPCQPGRGYANVRTPSDAPPNTAHTSDLWFSEDKNDQIQARLLCMQCPIATECAAAASSTHEPHGIYGGKTARQRAREARPRANHPSNRNRRS